MMFDPWDNPISIDPGGLEARRRGAVLRGAPAADARGGGLLHAEAGAPGERPGAGPEMMDIIYIYIDHHLLYRIHTVLIIHIYI